MKIHEKYMLRCIELGKKGLGNTAPNPMVGCSIVHENCIIGEGYTSIYGGPHAEVNAINSVKDKSLLSKASLYVTLEPCSHYGKTPPCADLIAHHKIPRVFIGLIDPNDKVAGRGIQKLKNSGCDVHVGILENQCRKHHKRFLTFQEKKRSYIILKWAQSKDGFIAPNKSKRAKKVEPFWISNPYSKQLVHKWRAEEQSILVGTNTAIEDNPKLTIRHWEGNNPIRIVLDKSLKTPANYHLLDGSVPTVFITETIPLKKESSTVSYKTINFSKPIANQICSVLYDSDINSVIIEGGSRTLQTFIEEDLWDEARIFTSSSIIQKGIKAPNITGQIVESKQISNDILTILYND